MLTNYKVRKVILQWRRLTDPTFIRYPRNETNRKCMLYQLIENATRNIISEIFLPKVC